MADEVNNAVVRVAHYAVSTAGQRLGVPVFATVAELVAEFPPEDLSALGVEPVDIRPPLPALVQVFGVAGSVAATAHRSLYRQRRQRLWVVTTMRAFVAAVILLTGLAAVTSLIARRWSEAAIDTGLLVLNLRLWGRSLSRRWPR